MKTIRQQSQHFTHSKFNIFSYVKAVDPSISMIGVEAQDAAWNRGDIDAFMEGYWKSPELRFASGGNVTRGWDETNARYHNTYGGPETMGTLVTDDYEIVLLGPDAAVAHGRWKLEGREGTPWGLYTLVLRKMGGEWKIVSDTTTSAG